MIYDLDSAAARARAVGALAIAVSMVWTTLATYAWHAALPANPIALPGEAAITVRTWAPEGWNFFSKNPHFERVMPYVPAHGGHWILAAVGPKSRPGNIFGLRRTPGAQERELEELANHVPLFELSSCTDDLEACLGRTPVFAHVRNVAPQPTLCGPLAIVLRRPPPWAWRNIQARTNVRTARLEVECSPH